MILHLADRLRLFKKAQIRALYILYNRVNSGFLVITVNDQAGNGCKIRQNSRPQSAFAGNDLIIIAVVDSARKQRLQNAVFLNRFRKAQKILALKLLSGLIRVGQQFFRCNPLNFLGHLPHSLYLLEKSTYLSLINTIAQTAKKEKDFSSGKSFLILLFS